MNPIASTRKSFFSAGAALAIAASKAKRHDPAPDGSNRQGLAAWVVKLRSVRPEACRPMAPAAYTVWVRFVDSLIPRDRSFWTETHTFVPEAGLVSRLVRPRNLVLHTRGCTNTTEKKPNQRKNCFFTGTKSTRSRLKCQDCRLACSFSRSSRRRES